MERSELIRQCQKKLHDINNRLGVITGYGCLLQEELNLSPEQKRNLEVIVDTALIVGSQIHELYDILKKLE
jgi:hypothetical protein